MDYLFILHSCDIICASHRVKTDRFTEIELELHKHFGDSIFRFLGCFVRGSNCSWHWQRQGPSGGPVTVCQPGNPWLEKPS